MNMDYLKRLEIRVHRDPFYLNQFEFLLLERTVLGSATSFAVGQPIVMATEDLAVRKQPTFALPSESAQQLMDELWRCGLRPTEGGGSAGAMAAVQAHLEDMRTIVFKPKA